MSKNSKPLKTQDQAYAVATVVRTIAVTAAKAGAKAIIKADGTITEGWIGGGCAKSAVQKAAKDAMSDGQPRLISILPDDGLKLQGVKPGEQKDGIHFARNMCPSQGSMDVFIEPILPEPELIIIGDSPVAQCLANLASPFDFTIQTHTTSEFEKPNAKRFIVIATQGRGDEAALRAALKADFTYLGFVGSRAKAQSLKDKLAQGDQPPQNLDAIKCPAGLDLGAISPEEIALSILAEIIQVRRSDMQIKEA